MGQKFVVVVCAAALALGACKSGGGDDGAVTATSVVTTTTIPREQLKGAASQITDQLIANKWDDVVSRFNAEMLIRLSAPALKTAWQTVVDQFGAFKSRGPTSGASTTTPDGVIAFDSPMTFGTTAMKSRISFDADGKVAGLFIVKA